MMMLWTMVGTKLLTQRLEILSLPRVWLYSLLNLTVNKQEKFQTNSAVHNINVRNKYQIHR